MVTLIPLTILRKSLAGLSDAAAEAFSRPSAAVESLAAKIPEISHRLADSDNATQQFVETLQESAGRDPGYARKALALAAENAIHSANSINDAARMLSPRLYLHHSPPANEISYLIEMGGSVAETFESALRRAGQPHPDRIPRLLQLAEDSQLVIHASIARLQTLITQKFHPEPEPRRAPEESPELLVSVRD